jgi:citrate lyase subunit gamma (acyl carrier protein)
MKLQKRALAGTLESSDVMIEIIPWDKPLEINLKSDVQKQYGDQILSLVHSILSESQIDNAYIRIVDKGALDFTISARLKTALYRASR